MALDGKIAIVTGASRGIGRGIALQLGAAGATVYVTGRPPNLSLQNTQQDLPTLQKTADEINERGGKGIVAYVDHSNMAEVEKFFKKVDAENDGALDLLVNNAFSAINALFDAAGKPFWECDPGLWDDVNNVGLRNNYYCSVYAARLMVPRKKGLIVNISSIGGLKYLFNVAYGVGKCGMDRMAADMAEELQKSNVTMVAVWPGIVRTEVFGEFLKTGKFDTVENTKVLKDAQTESPEFTGKAIVALASDPNVIKKTGRIILSADVALDYKFKDIDGLEPGSLRSVKTLLDFRGLKSLAAYVPPWLRLPGWMLTAFYSRL